MSEREHEVVIKCANPEAHRDRRKHVALCACGWKAQGTGDMAEVRLGRKADEHLRGYR